MVASRLLSFAFVFALFFVMTPPTSAKVQAAGQSLGIASVPNLRDLGGYETRDGFVTRRGLLYRSGALAPLTTQDLGKIAALSLKNDYDLRTADERKDVPDQLPSGVNDVWLNVLDDQKNSAVIQLGQLLRNPKEANKTLGHGKIEALFSKTYRDFVSLPSAQVAYRQLFVSLGNQDKLPALFHCTAGKDRTGWGAAAFLLLMGVPEDVVMKDYLKSNDYVLPLYKKEIDAFVANGGDPEITAAIFGVKEEYLRAAIDEVQRKYGSIEQYFTKALGIDAFEQRKLRDLYLRKK